MVNVAYIVSALLVLVCTGIALFISMLITRPVTKSVDFASAVAGGDLDRKLEVDQKDEFGVLADALRIMVANLKAKIAEAEQAKVHTMLVIGGRDMDAGNVSVRLHGKGNVGAKPKGEVVADIIASIRERRA